MISQICNRINKLAVSCCKGNRITRSVQIWHCFLSVPERGGIYQVREFIKPVAAVMPALPTAYSNTCVLEPSL